MTSLPTPPDNQSVNADQSNSDGITEALEQAVEFNAIVGDPDQTWRVLGLVNDWIKHAEAKAAGTLAAAGVSAGVLYNLVKDVADPSRLLNLVAVACAVCIIVGGLSAAWALRPRLWSNEEPTSNLYFHHIARRHPKKGKGTEYLPTLIALTKDHAGLVTEIAGQVWSNAHVAKSKFQAANVGLVFVLLGIVFLGATACAVAWNTW
jgi:hypothetical protein